MRSPNSVRVRVEQIFVLSLFSPHCRPRARGTKNCPTIQHCLILSRLRECSLKNERFWHTFQDGSKRRKMAVFVCQNSSQNQSAKTCAVLGFETLNNLSPHYLAPFIKRLWRIGADGLEFNKASTPRFRSEMSILRCLSSSTAL